MRIPTIPAGLWKALVPLAILAGAVWLVAELGGFLAEEMDPTETPAAVHRSADGLPTVPVRDVEVPIVEEAVGSIRAVEEIEVASRLLARVSTMAVRRAGQPVRAGELLVELESADLEAAVAEAEAAKRAAEETFREATLTEGRTRELFDKEIASQAELDRAVAALETARAAVDRAEESRSAARTRLGYATIQSPIDGLVIDKHVERGDTVAPGQPLVTLYDPTRMQLVASVRESLATTLRIGGDVRVAVDALGMECHGEVAEIVPRAAAGSRSFDVKVTGPCPEGVFSGMFGRLRIDNGTRHELRVPRAAVRSIGQVDLVHVVVDGVVQRRFVVLGVDRDDEVTVVSGLAAGEVVVADDAALTAEAVR